MIIMDGTINSQYGGEAISAFKKLLRHLTRVGGALSLIFHPNVFYNPEFPSMNGLYHKMLIASRDLGYCSETARTLQNRIPPRFKTKDENRTP